MPATAATIVDRGAKNDDSQGSLYLVGYPAFTFRPPDLGLFRIQVAAGYRLVISVRDGGTDPTPLHGPAVSLSFSLARLWGS